MPQDMFGAVANPSVKLGSQSRYTVPLSIAAHIVIFAIVIVVPLMAPDVFPSAPSVMVFVAAAAPPPPAPPPPAEVATQPRAMTPQQAPDAAPTSAPDRIAPDDAAPRAPAPDGVPGGVEAGVPGGVPGMGSSVLPVAPAPQLPTHAVRPGGNIKAPTKIRDVRPVYPAIAQSAQVEGVVIIEATIGVDGRVRDARVLRSIPLLDQAALEAVRQWLYTPTQLNGVPVAVIISVTVNFKLR